MQRFASWSIANRIFSEWHCCACQYQHLMHADLLDLLDISHVLMMSCTRYGHCHCHCCNRLIAVALALREREWSYMWFPDALFGLGLLLLSVVSFMWHASNVAWVHYVDLGTMETVIFYLQIRSASIVVRSCTGISKNVAAVGVTALFVALAAFQADMNYARYRNEASVQCSVQSVQRTVNLHSCPAAQLPKRGLPPLGPFCDGAVFELGCYRVCRCTPALPAIPALMLACLLTYTNTCLRNGVTRLSPKAFHTGFPTGK